MNVIKLDYDFGEAVYLKTDNDQMERLVTAISIRPDGIKYGLSCGMYESFHYDFEFTRNRDILKATSD